MFFFWAFIDQDKVEVHKHAKERKRPRSSNLSWQNQLDNKVFIIWEKSTISLRDTAASTAGNPEQARKYHVSRSGSQSQLRIRLKGLGHVILGNFSTDQIQQQQCFICSNH